MRVLLMEANDTDAIAWMSRYRAACKSLGLPRDVEVSRANSLGEGLARLEGGEAFDMVVVSPELPGVGRYATEALEAVRRVAPSAAVQVYAQQKSRALSDQIEVDPFASLALKRPAGDGRDTELEALIQEAYRRGKVAIQEIDRQLLPLVERARHLEDEVEQLREDFARQFLQLRQDVQRSQDAVVLATVDLPDLQRSVKRLEKRMQAVDGISKDIGAVRHSLALMARLWGALGRQWQWAAGLLAGGAAAPFVVKAVLSLFAGG